MNNPQTQAEIAAIEHEYRAEFRIAISQLFYTGIERFTDELVEVTVDALRKEKSTPKASTSKSISIMTADFKINMLLCAQRLAKYDVWDVLLYVKQNVDITDPLAQTDDADDECF